MIQLAIIGIVAAVIAVLAASWNGGKNPSNPKPPTPNNPNPPTTPNNPNNPQPSPTTPDTLISNPPLLQKNSKGTHELIVAYKTGKIYNPRNSTWDQLFVRGYLTNASLFNKKKAGESVEDLLVGPQIRVKQGETLKINLNNQLPPEQKATCPDKVDNVNDPHCFNTTNLHTHGFWVSPQGNSDNVFLKFKPQEKFDYQYKMEPNHPAGTYWYHAHLHGSTAIQVSSGMAGPLIVEGSRTPKVKNGKVTETGDMDILWKEKNSYPNEKILLFQQIQYRCSNPDPDVKFDIPNNCEGKGLGLLEDYTDIANPSSWAGQNFYTSINGKVLGEIKVEQNAFNRWRMIHGGVRDTIGLIIKELPNSSKFSAADTLKACLAYQEADPKEFNESLKSLPVYTIAQDGLTMTQVQRRTLSVFQPGYRHDAMVTFPTTNKYCIYDSKLNIEDEVNAPIPTGQITPQLAPNHPFNAQLLGWVNVQASKTKAQTPAQFLQERAKKIGLSKEIQTQLSKLDLTAFTDHPSLMTPAIDKLVASRPKQYSKFELAFANGLKFGFRHKEDGDLLSFGDAFDGEGSVGRTHAKDPDREYVRQLQIGQTDEWELTTEAFGGHPFHIHVNPFQIVKILKTVTGPNGESKEVDVSELAPDDNDTDDVQYRGMKGQFKDTLFIKANYKFILRSHYKKFEGDFVQHCHILDHEDQGMMETVRVCGGKFPCDSPLPTSSHHH
ncbi:multicopper oxidase domain-containing protein [Acinetobacter variabilis]|uniref:multicopper oxidase family protein n=1 Tax=Acinetobacter variabilis TaxID=70346 RepID=UPI0021CE03A4|nr:multicopper oxidase family protein [Acinetobacter variabilis]MCU4629988.1 multicopper oxidase domain-containing protein [Acinetobacter variabilis]